MILYPTETVYGIGVDVFDEQSLTQLFVSKGRDERKTVSWLVRDIEDVARYAEVSTLTHRIAETFLPGPLTVVLPAKDIVPQNLRAEDGTVGFRISSDVVAQKVIAEHWQKHATPLTCTSANVSGLPTLSTPEEIIEQFTLHSPQFAGFTTVYDDGPRKAPASTIVRVVDDTLTIIRPGSISEAQLQTIL